MTEPLTKTAIEALPVSFKWCAFAKMILVDPETDDVSLIAVISSINLVGRVTGTADKSILSLPPFWACCAFERRDRDENERIFLPAEFEIAHPEAVTAGDVSLLIDPDRDVGYISIKLPTLELTVSGQPGVYRHIIETRVKYQNEVIASSILPLNIHLHRLETT